MQILLEQRRRVATLTFAAIFSLAILANVFGVPNAVSASVRTAVEAAASGAIALVLGPQEFVSKTGVAGATPTGGTGSTNISWTINYGLTTNSTSPLANVGLSDQWNAGQTLVPGSLKTPGGLWSSSQPDGTSLSFNNPLVPAAAKGVTQAFPKPVGTGVTFTGSGDGYNPAITASGKIMGVNHHINPSFIWCYDMKSGASCPGYKKSLPVATGYSPTTIAIGNKIYFSDDSSNTNFGQTGHIYCWDSDTNAACGQSPQVFAVGLARVDTKLFTQTTAGALDCFDTANNLNRCSGFTAVPFGIAPGNTLSFSSPNASGGDLFAVGSKVYIAGWQRKLACFDAAANTACTGFPALPGVIATTATGNSRSNIFPRLSGNGAVTGICVAGQTTDATCYNLDASSPVNVTMSATHHVYTAISGNVDTYVGSRVFFANYGAVDKISCWDWATVAPCTGSGFDASGYTTAAVAPRTYGMTNDGVNVFSFGDAGILNSWDTRNGTTPATRVATTASVNIDDYYCGTPDAVPARWDKITLSDVNLTSGVEFTSLKVSLKDPSTGGTVFGPVEAIGTTGVFDVSTVPGTYRTLQLVADETPVGTVAWNDNIAPKVSLMFASDAPVQFCYQTVVSCNGTASTFTDTISTMLDPHSAVADVTACSLSPNLGVVKSAPSPSLKPGQLSTYNITVTNNGSASATAASVKEGLPAGLDLVSIGSMEWSCNTASKQSPVGTISCAYTGGALAPGASSSFSVQVQPRAAYAGSTVINYVSVDPTSGANAPNPTNCTGLNTPSAGCGVPVSSVVGSAPPNSAPTAYSQSLSTSPSTALPVTLSATDPDGNFLFYSVKTGPSNGTLSGSAQNLTYIPANGFIGMDSFTFVANDGFVDSAPATISIQVVRPNSAPVAQDVTLSTDEDTSVGVTLVAVDPDNDPLNYVLLSNPQHGTISGIAPNLIYSPAAEYSGPDEFIYQVNDGRYLYSNPATVRITVVSVDDAPVVTAPPSQNAREAASQQFDLGSFADVDGGYWSALVEWGDGTHQTIIMPDPGSLGSQPHTFYSDGVYDVTVTVTDRTNLAGSQTFQVTVADSTPVVKVQKASVTVDEGQTAANSGTFSDPSSGEAITVTASTGTITRSSGTIQYASSIGGLVNPIEMAFDSQHNLFVAEDGAGAVSKFGPNGGLITRWSIGGAATGIAVDGIGNVYVASKALNTVQIFSNSGGFIRTVGGGLLSAPHGITVDSAGLIYVTNANSNRVVVMDNSGALVRQWGGFNFPQGIALDSAGNVYVTNRNTNQLRKFTATGSLITQWSVAGNTAGVGIDSADEVFVSNFSSPSVQVFSSTGTPLYSFGTFGGGAGQFNLPHGVEFDSNGNIWVADWANGRVQKWTIPNTWNWTQAADDGPTGSQSVTVTARDANGLSSSVTFDVTVKNVAPTGTLTNSGPVGFGSTAAVSFSGQQDPSSADTMAGFHYAFDLDNDGTFDVGDGTYAGSGSAASAAVLESYLPHAGTYTIQGRIIDKDSGSTSYSTALTVNPATATAKADDKTITYGDPEPAFTYTATGLVGSGTLTGVTCGVAGPHTAAGTYPIMCSGNTNPNYSVSYIAGTLTVKKAAVTVTADPMTFGYAEADHPHFTYTASGLLNGDTLTGVTCSVAGAHSAAGTYSIVCSGNSNGNYSVTYVPGVLTINPREVTIKAEDKSKTFGEGDPALTYQITSGSLVGGDGFTGSLARAAGEDVGSYGIGQGTVALSSNYALSFEPGTLNIGQAPSFTTVTCTGSSFVYDGTPQTPCSVAISGVGLNLTAVPAYSPNTDVGHVVANYTYPGDLNHKGSSGAAEFDITKAPATVTVTAADATFDGGQHGGTAKVTGVNDLNETLLVTYVGRGSTEYGPTHDAPVNAGDYTASATYAGTDNYSDNTASTNFTIHKASSTTTVTCTGGPFVYSGSAFKPCSAIVEGVGIGMPADVSYADNVNAGTATVSASFDGDANHTGSSDSETFSIAKADQTIIFGALNATTFGAADFTIQATSTAGLPVTLVRTAGTCSLSTDTSPAIVHITGAGNCSIKASQAGTGNYNAAPDEFRSFSIAKAAQVINFAPLGNVTFGAADFNVTATGGASGNPVTFTATGNCTVSGNTVHITGAGSCLLKASQAGNGNYDPAAELSQSFNIAKANSAITVSAPAYAANGGSYTFSGVLTGVANAPLAGQTVTFSIGTQSCQATTNATGAATCNINGVNQQAGPGVVVTSAFSGNSNYLGSGATTQTFVYSYAAANGGAFVIGDRNAAVGTNVTYWGAQWTSLNGLSGGAAPAAFKGFANRSSTTPASVGATWTTDPGNSSNPPATVPAYMAVIVTSTAAKSGSTISGNTTKVVIVRTNTGYAADPGKAGTGTVVAVLP